MTDILATTRDVLGAHGVCGGRVCVGLSGGVDSVVLLDVLRSLATERDIELSAVHVNHGLQADAGQWSQFCREFCARLGVPLRIEQVQVSRNSGLGTEAAARALRYAVFAKLPVDHVALAHHQDDQAETLLLQLLRGAGASGLSAMPAKRLLEPTGPALLRPFLALTRARLTEFARGRGLDWVEDNSNSELAFERNFLRHRVLPLIAQRFPAYRETLSRASRNLADSARMADILGRQDLAAARRDDAIEVECIASWPRSRAVNMLRCLFRELGQPVPRRAALGEALRQALEAHGDAQVRVDFGQCSVRRYRGRLYVVQNVTVPEDWSVQWRGESCVRLPAGLGELRFRASSGAGLSADRLGTNAVEVAMRRGGERMAVGHNRPRRDLRKLFQEAGVAPWKRQRMPLLMCDGRLALVPGVGAAAEFQASPGEPSWLVDWVEARAFLAAAD